MLGHRKSLGKDMIGHKKPLNGQMLGFRNPLGGLPSLVVATQRLAENKKMGGLERSLKRPMKQGSGWNLGGYA